MPQFLGLPGSPPQAGRGWAVRNKIFWSVSWLLWSPPAISLGGPTMGGWAGTLRRRNEPAAPLPWACLLQLLSSLTVSCPLLARAAPAISAAQT